jgi:hypothetical protein
MATTPRKRSTTRSSTGTRSRGKAARASSGSTTSGTLVAPNVLTKFRSIQTKHKSLGTDIAAFNRMLGGSKAGGQTRGRRKSSSSTSSQ